MAFYVVYIAEAHPSDIWQMQNNIKERVIFRNPTTPAERQDVATSCVRKLHITIPALIDGIDNRVEQQYTAWPDRLFVVGRDGTLRYKSEPGPFGFDAKKLESALRDSLGPVKDLTRALALRREQNDSAQRLGYRRARR